MPSLRAVSKDFKISLTTAIQAFLSLESSGLIISRPRSGYFVSYRPPTSILPEVSRPRILAAEEVQEVLIDELYLRQQDPKITGLSVGALDKNLLPLAKLTKEVQNAMRSLSGSGALYEPVQGNERLRNNIARHTYCWKGELLGSDIVTTAGAMNAVSFSLMALTTKGDTIAVESPVYFGILQLAKNLGLNVFELPTHPSTGIDPDALKKVLPKIKACILVSNFSNPLGSCMPEEHKRVVVKMLSRAGVPLIEDDLYGDLYFGELRPKPCKAFDEEGMVLWSGSVSKTLAPGFRVGWIAPGRFKEKIIQQKMVHSFSSTAITQEAIAGFLETGRYEHHLRGLRRRLKDNVQRYRQAIEQYFPEGTKISRPDGGFLLWVELENKINTVDLLELSLKRNISIAPGRMFSLQGQFQNCLRLSYGQQWNDNIDRKLKVLGNLAKLLL